MSAKQMPKPDPLQLLAEELRAVQQELALAYDRFNRTTEPELIEACIYEIKALNARFNYFYRAIRQQGGCPIDEEARAAGELGGVGTWT